MGKNSFILDQPRHDNQIKLLENGLLFYKYII